MSEYSILAKLQLDTSGVEAKLKSYNPAINVKAKITGMSDSELAKLNTTVGTLQNKLEKLKVSNVDAFKTSGISSQYAHMQDLIGAYSRGETSLDNVNVEMGKFQNNITRTNQGIRTTTNSTDNFTTAIGKAVTKIALWGVATGLLYGSLKKIQEGVQYIKDLNKEMTDTQIVTGYTEKQISNLASQYNGLAIELGATTLEVAKGALEWQRQGKTISETQQLLRASVMMAKLANMDQADSTESLTSIMNGFKLTIDEVIPTIDKLVSLDNNFATSTQEISDALTKVSAVSKQSNISLEEMAAMITVVSSDTRIAAESIGQSFKTILMRMQNVKIGKYLSDEGEDISDVEKVLSSLDIKLRDDKNTWRDFSDVLVDVREKWDELGKSGDTVTQSMLVNAFAGQRQANILTALLNDQEKYNQALVIEAEALGTTESRYKIFNDSIEANSNKLKASIEAMWSKTVSEDLIKDILKLGTGVVNLISNLGGLVPVLLAISASLLVIKAQSIGTSIIQIITYIPRLITMLVLWKQGMLGVAGATMAAASAQALLTGGISILVAGVVLLIANADKFGNSMTNLNDKLQKNYEEVTKNVDDLKSLASEYENLANKADKSADDLVRLMDIQTILNTKYGYATDGVNAYTAAVDSNSQAIKENIEWIQKKADLEAKEFIQENKESYGAALGYLSTSTTRSVGTGVTGLGKAKRFEGTPEEILSELGKEKSNPWIKEMIDTYQEEISSAQELIINYEHYLNVLNATNNNAAVSANSVTEHLREMREGIADTVSSIEELPPAVEDLVASSESLSSAMDAVAKAASEQSNEGKISYETALDLITANANLAQYLTATADGYIFDAEAARAATQQELINEFAKYGLQKAAIAAANGNYILANSMIVTAKLAAEETARLQGLLKTFAAMSIKISIPSVSSSGGSSVISEQEELNKLKKQGYEDEIKSINAQKKAVQDQKKALEAQRDAYHDIIDAKKESLRLDKEQKDYQDELGEKNKELADIDDQLFAIQFDNSQEAKAKRLKLEEEKAEKIEEIAKMQADRTYDIQIEALDAEADAYDKWIDMQLAGIDLVIDRFDIMIEKINEMIDALSRIAESTSAGGSNVVSKPATKKIVSPITKPSEAKKRGTAFADGGSFETNNEGLIKVHPEEVGAVLNRSQIQAASPLASLFYNIMKKTGVASPQFVSNLSNDGNNEINVTMPITVQGNLDKVKLQEVKQMVFTVMNDVVNHRGKKANVFNQSI